jgi:hypothetical protein
VWLEASRGKGMELQGTFVRRASQIHLDMTISNRAMQPLSGFAIQFNMNSCVHPARTDRCVQVRRLQIRSGAGAAASGASIAPEPVGGRFAAVQDGRRRAEDGPAHEPAGARPFLFRLTVMPFNEHVRRPFKRRERTLNK